MRETNHCADWSGENGLSRKNKNVKGDWMKKEKIDCVIMDPPRKGSDVSFMNAVLKLMPKKVLYISCNPYTQCEDLKLLYDKYVIKYIQPVDMFPHTASIENIITLERKN